MNEYEVWVPHHLHGLDGSIIHSGNLMSCLNALADHIADIPLKLALSWGYIIRIKLPHPEAQK